MRTPRRLPVLVLHLAPLQQFDVVANLFHCHLINMRSIFTGSAPSILGEHQKKKPAWILFLLVSISLLVSSCVGLREIGIAPDEFPALKAAPEILAAHHPMYNLRYSAGGNRSSSKYRSEHYSFPPPEDPTGEVQEHFVTGLRTELGLNNIRSIREPRYLRGEPSSRIGTPARAPLGLDRILIFRPDKQLSALQDEFGTGLVFDFTPHYWELIEFGSYETFFYYRPTSPTNPAILWYAVQGRLTRLDTPIVLWQAVCYVKLPLQIKKTTTAYYLAQDPNSDLNLIRAKAAAQCGDELVRKFVGK